MVPQISPSWCTVPTISIKAWRRMYLASRKIYLDDLQSLTAVFNSISKLRDLTPASCVMPGCRAAMAPKGKQGKRSIEITPTGDSKRSNLDFDLNVIPHIYPE